MKPVSIVILGGGTAGWITASWLMKQFGSNPAVQITLIESQSIGILGVGEATVPSIIPFLRLLGLSEAEFMRATNATFKQGILYRNWAKNPEKGRADTYFHPFDSHNIIAFNPAQWWLAHKAAAPDADYANDICAQYGIAMAGRAPKTREMADYQGETSYAYHLDAELFANYLMKWCKKRGINHIIDDVISAERNGDGTILAIKAKQAGKLVADIFVDCSGFKGLLINQSLENKFHSYSDILFCDQAVALRVPLVDGAELRPYTTTTALKDGWIWEIDLQGRRGIGYVHSSRHCTFDKAEEALRAYIGAPAESLTARRLKMRVGRSEKIWDKNVIAIGLSAGFIEPLESTGIYLVEVGARLLANALIGVLPIISARKEGRLREVTGQSFEHEFQLNDPFSAVASVYNKRMNSLFEEIRDFVKIHYSLSRRTDSEFWTENRNERSIPETLQEYMRLWAIRPPDNVDFSNRYSLFNENNWLYIMLGMGWRPGVTAEGNKFVPLDVGNALIQLVGKIRQRGLSTLPGHRQYFENPATGDKVGDAIASA